MKLIRRFNSVSDMNTAVQTAPHRIVAVTYENGRIYPKIKRSNRPKNLVISCTENIVRISAIRATSILYRTDPNDAWTTYTEPFAISETVTVYAKAVNAYGEITTSKECAYVPLPSNLTISCSANTVTISATDATTIQYRTNPNDSWTTYTEPFAISETVTVYAKASNSYGEITGSQECVYVAPPSNLVISCTNNTVTITADNATTIEYNTDGSSTYTTYTEPFAISETVTVYAKASNSVGEITGSQQCVYIPLPSNLVISCTNNTVTISADNATTIEYNTDGSSTYTTYSGPFSISESVTVYAKASNSVGSITGSQVCTLPSNLSVTCTANTVTISATDATTIQYRTDPNDAWTTYTQPFAISETVTVYAKASNSVGEITGSQLFTLPSNLAISCSANTVTISATDATTIQYRTNPSGSWVTYSAPFAISETVTVYAKASNAVGEITGSQECVYSGYTIPLYIENTSNESATVSIVKSNGSAPTLAIEKSTDGTTWESMGSTSTATITATVPVGGKLYLRSSATAWSTSSYYNTITCNKAHKVGGNINSLLYGSSFNGQTEFPNNVSQYCLKGIFGGDINLINTLELQLPATTLTDYCYQNMFSGCTSLTTAPATLSATTLVQNCYSSMFSGCTALTAAPELPATTLADSCYSGMFNGCTSLTTAPELPATTLANYCYQSMFGVCSSLTTAPVLPATTLATGCYYYMFSGCTSLTSAPALPATTLAESCYKSMFERCTALTAIPELPAPNLTNYCYHSMFRYCSNLNYIKCLATNLSGTNSKNAWVEGVAATGTFVKDLNMNDWPIGNDGIPSGWVVQNNGDAYPTPFYIENTSNVSGTVSIAKNNSSAPTVTIEKSSDGITWENMGTTSTTAITATIPASGKLYLRSNARAWGMIDSGSVNFNTITCNKTHKVGGNITSLLYGNSFVGQTGFPSLTLYVNYATFCYLFYNDTYLSNASELLLLATRLTVYCYRSMFQGCTALTSTPTILPATTLAQGCYQYMFQNCTALTTAPVLPATTLAQGCYHYMFYKCTSLTTAPVLPATTLVQNCYSSMFSGCTALTAAPELPATTLVNSCYSSMFYGCTSLTTAPDLPATTLAQGCYQYMFQNCTALTTAPVLPATTLAVGCYNYMFYSCNSLNYIKCLATDISASNCTGGWVNDVAETGTFIKDPNMSSWTEGTGGIPIGWVVQNFTVPTNLTITYSLNTVSINAIGATTIQYNLTSSSGPWITYTQPFEISETVTVYAKASNASGDTTTSQECVYVAPPNNLSITCTSNTVTISATGATTIQYRTNPNSEWVTYTASFSITEITTVYAKASNAGGEITGLLVCALPYNLTISCSTNTVTISATDATTIQYRTDPNDAWTTYTQPFAISETVTVYAKASNSVGEITGSQLFTLPSNLAISCSANTVTISATDATTIQYRTNPSGSWVTYSAPFAISETVTVYAKASNAYSEITGSQLFTLPSNLTISCSANTVTISATDATTIQYRTDPNDAWTTYSAPFAITETVTVYAKASNSVGEITGSQECVYVVPPSNLTISCSANTVTISATDATTIQYRTSPSGEWVTYTQPFAITETVTVYAKASNSVGEITGSQECVYVPLPYNLTISCSANTVTISATDATTIQYRTNPSGEWVTYSAPFAISETVTVYAKASNAYGEITGSQLFTLPSNLVISCTANTVTISATDATAIQYRTDPNDAWTTYSAPFAISETVTVYAKASNAYGEISGSQECVYKGMSDTPFYIEDISGSENTITIKKINGAPHLTIYKSTDGENWVSMGETSASGKTAKVPANGKLYFRCSATQWANSSSTYTYFETASGDFNVGGNINSLLYGSSFNGQTEFPSGVGAYTFRSLFKSNTRIKSAQDLLLPAASAENCYESMFMGCTGLTTAPATLPATTLAQRCYATMFYGCSALTTAPVLPVTTLVNQCYAQMFWNCTNLNYIECLATDISASGCTRYWVNNVAASGTFVKDPNMSSWTTGVDGIPTNWTVEDNTN